MHLKTFEIIAECEMPGFATTADITRVSDQIETARRTKPDVVRATVNPPVIYRDQRYVLQTKFIVWAEDAPRALQTTQALLAAARLPCRTILPSARALTEAVPEPSKPRRPAAGAPTPSLRRVPRKATRKPRPRVRKGSRRRKARSS